MVLKGKLQAGERVMRRQQCDRRDGERDREREREREERGAFEVLK